MTITAAKTVSELCLMNNRYEERNVNVKKQDFDLTIKENLGLSSEKYLDKPYDYYFNKPEFEKFKAEMKKSFPEAYKSFDFGKGGEMEETLRNDKVLPPKMASVASSSRFAYLALRNGVSAIGGGNVVFEHPCKIEGVRGIPPQMDAYSSAGNIFIEVKCHEIFDKHKIIIKTKYKEKLEDFGLFISGEGEKVEIPLSEFDIKKETSMFDIKQLLCHLMGVKSHSNGDRATLLYLFFKPQNEKYQNEIDSVFEELKSEIKTIFESKPIKKFCNSQITLKAVCQTGKIMQALKDDNIEVLY